MNTTTTKQLTTNYIICFKLHDIQQYIFQLYMYFFKTCALKVAVNYDKMFKHPNFIGFLDREVVAKNFLASPLLTPTLGEGFFSGLTID